MYAQASKFREIAELGKGGMGDVFLTVASGSAGVNKLLVVKRLRHSLASDPEFLRMFLNEARLAARLNHPNIVNTYEVGFDGSYHFMAMEYLEGQSLCRLVRRAATSGGVSMEMQLRVLADALGGLNYAHELTDYDGNPLEIVHRDFSPANIFVLYDGQVKLVDFGIAKSANSAETRAGIFKGKIQYVSPEQYTGGSIDRRSDIYSAGVILWEVATQRRMWKGAGDLTVMQRVAAGDVPSPSTIDPKVPKRLEAMCMKALAVQKEDRYPTAAALQADIEEYLLQIGSRVSARDVGTFTAKTFADARAHLKVLIEDQLRAMRDNPDQPSVVPVVTLVQGTGTDSTPLSYPASISRRHRSRLAIAIGAGLTFVAALVAVAVWRRPSPAGTAAALANELPVNTSAPVPRASEPEVTPLLRAGAKVRLTLTTMPKNAQVSLDDALLPDGTHVLQMSRDNALHRVRAEAPGFRSKMEWVRFDSDDVAVKITLDPNLPARKWRRDPVNEAPPPSEPAVARPVQPAAAPTPPAIREIESPPGMRRPTPQPLDTADPWK